MASETAQLPVCIESPPGSRSWLRVFDVLIPVDAAVHLPAELRVASYDFVTPQLVRTLDVVPDPANEASAQQQYVGFAKYISMSRSVGKPRVALVSAPTLLEPTRCVYILAALDASGSPLLEPTIEARLRVGIPEPKAAQAGAATSASSYDAALSINLGKRSKPDDLGVSYAPSSQAGALGKRPRLGEVEAASSSAASAAPIVARETTAWRFVVYPDNRGDLITSVLHRRAHLPDRAALLAAGASLLDATQKAASGAGGHGGSAKAGAAPSRAVADAEAVMSAALARPGAPGFWVDAMGGSVPSARGHWSRVEATVLNNNWDFIWKPTVNFKSNALPPSAWRGREPGAAAAPGFYRSPHYEDMTSLHSLPLPPASGPGAHVRPQVVNRMPQPRAISSKSNMFRSLCAWYGALGLHPSAIAVPTTFLVQSNDPRSIAAFRERYSLLNTSFAAGADARAGAPSSHVSAASAEQLVRGGERTPASHCMHNMWIIKPDHLFAGRGIELASSLSDIEAFLAEAAEHGVKTPEGSKVDAGALWVVQKYIERPLLLASRAHGARKFDVRVNVLVTDDWKVFVYRDAICRTSSLSYSLPGEGPDSAAAATGASGGAGAAAGGASSGAGAAPTLSKTVHVTNNCYQVTCDAFGAHEEGNILSLRQLQTYLDAAYGSGVLSVERDLFPRWVELVLDVLCAARMHCVSGPPAARRWFDILGFDFLVDEHGRSWLVEANTNPSIDFHCPYTDGLFVRLLEEAARLTLDRHFPPAAPPEPLPAAVFSQAGLSALPWATDVQRVPHPPCWRSAGDAAAPTSAAGAVAGPDGAAVAAPLPAACEPGGGLAPVFERDPAHAAWMRRWELVWSERGDITRIPHQAAMAGHALNGKAVEEVLAREGAGVGAVAGAAAGGAGSSGAVPAGGVASISDAEAYDIAERHGLSPLLSAITAAEEHSAGSASTGAAASSSSAAASGGSGAMSRPSPFWRPALRRFIRRRDAAWLYPLGAPEDAQLAIAGTGDGAAAASRETVGSA